MQGAIREMVDNAYLDDIGRVNLDSDDFSDFP